MRKTSSSMSVVAALCALFVAGAPTSAQNLFFDNFDATPSSAYTVNQDPDSAVTFMYNYSADGIPSAPHSAAGTTLGVKFEANIVAPTGAQALNISPVGRSFTGDFVLKFDMWINANGPFPLGGTGSTEFITAGVGTAGFSVQKSSGNSDGAWFAVDGEGGSSIDYRAYLGISLEGPSSTAYAAPVGTFGSRDANNPYYQTSFPGGQQAPASQQAAFPASANPAENQEGALKPGTVGFAWRDVVITKVGSDVSWSIDGLQVATFGNATLAGDNIFVGYWDVFASVSANAAVSFGLVDNLRLDAVPEPSAAALGLIGATGLFATRRRNQVKPTSAGG
jgi:MYXO-CTERM domain-containing protein